MYGRLLSPYQPELIEGKEFFAEPEDEPS